MVPALLAGCTGQPTTETATPQPSAAATAAPTVAPTPSTAPEPAVVLPDGVEAENNGGYFLGLGKYVFFREYDKAAFPEAPLWGEFLSYSNPDTGASLRVYDAGADRFVTSYSDDGFGPLWYSGGKLWLTMTDGESYHVYTRDPDGTGRTEVAYGQVMGVSDSGELVCIQGNEPGKEWTRLSLWREGAEVAAVEPASLDTLIFCGFVGEAVLYLRFNGDTMETNLWQLTEDGKTLCLGVVPGGEDAFFIPELEQMETEGRNTYLMFGYYAGTGHFLYDYRCVKVLLNSPNSLVELDLSSEGADPNGEVPPILVSDGEVMLVPGKAGEVTLSWETYGDLDYIDSPYSALRLVPNFIPDNPYAEEGGLMVQTAQKVGENVYLMVADAEHDPEGDIGWRWAYRLKEMYYLRVPVQEPSTVNTLTGPDWEEHLSAGALLSVRVGLTEAAIDAAGPRIKVGIANDDGLHEPTERKWFLATALADGLQVRVEETDVTNGLASRLGWEGEFLWGRTDWDGVLNKGECIAVLAGTPWNYEARVSARQGNRFGSYVFGEDNWAYSTLPDEDQPVRYVTGYEQPDPDYRDEQGLFDFLDGSWVYRDPDTAQPMAILTFDAEEGTLRISDSEEEIHLATDHIYTGEEDPPDLLCLLSPGESSLGDYLVDCVITDTEELVWLRQANNGDGILSELIPSMSEYTYNFLLHRYRGGECDETPYQNTWFPGLVWKHDRENNCLWVTPTFEYEWDDMMEASVWCHAYNHRITAYPIADPGGIGALRDARNADYPMGVYWITTKGGKITLLEDPADVKTDAGHG